MPYTRNRDDNEKSKFEQDPGDQEANVRIVAKNTASNPVIITPSGLNTAGKVTEVTIDDTAWTALPATALSGRNAIAIQNKTGFQCKVKYDQTGGYAGGMVIEDNEERDYDIRENIVIYGRAEPGAGSVVLFVEELA